MFWGYHPVTWGQADYFGFLPSQRATSVSSQE